MPRKKNGRKSVISMPEKCISNNDNILLITDEETKRTTKIAIRIAEFLKSLISMGNSR